MTEDRVLSGRVTQGKLTVRGWKPFIGWPDGEVTITVAAKRATRSALQNAYYFGVCLRLLSEHTGYTVDELHEYCKQRFNAKTVCLVDADGVVKDESRVGMSTAKLNRITFGEYCEAIRIWAAADLDVRIPDPNPAWKEEAA
jgi:hypothetical protein